ncbi:hypothetical protein KCU81_g6423, partial [Aureobasidium melanogenum]|uniref:Uncharacterized protein n=1 Tax=Aureobasidium melanogenum (strain CBS 110374) TaxID=1043003 RepID=A0A074VUR4_AURM1
MSDVHSKDKIEEEELSLEEYKVLVKRLRQEAKQRDVDLEEAQGRISALEEALALSSDATTIFNLQEEIKAAKHRENCGDEREEEQREQIAELHHKLVDAEFDVELTKKALAREKEITEGLRSDKGELVRELYQKTVELSVKTALLEGRT